MAAPGEILPLLEMLLHAYPGKKLSRPNLQVYIDHLSDIHPHLLEMSIDNLIASSTWFPRVAEIRAEAGKIVGHNFISAWQPPPDTLRARFYKLENQFFHHRILDPDAWLALADDFDRSNRPHSAKGARQRLSIFQQLLAKENKSISDVTIPE